MPREMPPSLVLTSIRDRDRQVRILIAHAQPTRNL